MYIHINMMTINNMTWNLWCVFCRKSGHGHDYRSQILKFGSEPAKQNNIYSGKWELWPAEKLEYVIHYNGYSQLYNNYMYIVKFIIMYPYVPIDIQVVNNGYATATYWFCWESSQDIYGYYGNTHGIWTKKLATGLGI